MGVSEVAAPTGETPAVRARRLEWVWLLVLCIAPLLIVALTQDIGAHAYDAAVEHIQRGVAFSDVISDGVLYPRWSQALHWGLGSPLFTFQPPLPYYGLDLLFRLGLPHSLGWRWLMAAGYALAFLGAYLLVRELGGRRWPALVAAVAYAYAPYVIRNGLERGSNEAYSMFLYPLVLWSLLVLARRQTVGRFLLAVVIWAVCIGSHVLGPLMLAPFAGLMALYLWWRKGTPAPLLALLAGGLLTAFIWAPMLPEERWVHVERDFSQKEAIPANNPMALADLLGPPAVYDVAFDNNKTGDRVGLAQTALLLAGALAVPWAWRKNRRIAVALAAASLTGLFLFFLFTPASDGLWWLGGSVASRLLYRTRLMGLQALAAAITAGLLVALLPRRGQRIAGALLVALLVVVALPSLYVQYQHRYADFSRPPDLAGVRAMEIEHGGRALTAFGEFEPKWRTLPFDRALLDELGPEFDAQARPLAGQPNGIEVIRADVRNQSWDLALRATAPATATLHLLYYPRWQAVLDGKPVALGPQAETGYAQVAVPAGEHRLVLSYGLTRSETAGLIISAATLLVLVAWAIWATVRRRRQAGDPTRTAGSAGDSALQPRSQGASLRAGPRAAAWTLTGLTLLLVLKAGVIDPQTTLLRRSSTCEAVAGATEVAVRFGEQVRLCAMSTVPSSVEPNQRLTTTLYWTIDAPVQERLVSFVHLLGTQFNPATGTPLWGQVDTEAPAGLPVEKWLPGKLYRDEYSFDVADGAPPGPYQLEIGWYPAGSGSRIAPVIERPAPNLGVSDLDALLVQGPAVK